jgi:hypothetical protein
MIYCKNFCECDNVSPAQQLKNILLPNIYICRSKQLCSCIQNAIELWCKCNLCTSYLTFPNHN